MKVAVVMEIPPDALDRLRDTRQSYAEEYVEVRMQRDGTQRLPILNATWRSSSRWCPALLFEVDDRLPLGDSIILRETGQYKPTPEEIKRITERLKDAGSGQVVRTSLSTVWRSIRPAAINEAIEACLTVMRTADPKASTLWQFVEGDLFDRKKGAP